MSFIAEQRRAQQLCMVAVSLCLDRPRMIQDIETFLVEQKERVTVTELYDVLLYAIGKGYLEYFAEPGYPTRYVASHAGVKYWNEIKQQPHPLVDVKKLQGTP